MTALNRFKFLASLAIFAVAAIVTTTSSAYAHRNLALQMNEVVQIACPSGTSPAVYGNIVRCQAPCKLIVTDISKSHCSDQGGCYNEYRSQFALYESNGEQVLLNASEESYKEQEVIRQIKADFAQACPLINVINN